MIRQAISCDICGAEKRQTNHWFVAYEASGELRLGSWASRNRSRPGSKHLCGQTCMHKFVDEFMARIIAIRPQAAESDLPVASSARTDSSLTAGAASMEIESSIRLITPPVAPPASPQPVRRALPESARFDVAEFAAPLDEPPRSTSRSARSEAWERERERTLRGAGRRPELIGRRHP
ncbi:MAG TPA: hypothetical protein VGG26_09745 [Terracidiphilus sp.]